MPSQRHPQNDPKGRSARSIDEIFPKVETVNQKLLLQAKEKTEKRELQLNLEQIYWSVKKGILIEMNTIELRELYRIGL